MFFGVNDVDGFMGTGIGAAPAVLVFYEALLGVSGDACIKAVVGAEEEVNVEHPEDYCT